MSFLASKKLASAWVHHAIVWTGVLVGGAVNHATLSTSIVAAISSSTAVSLAHLAGQSTVDVKQATSPYFAQPGQPYPPPPPVIIPPTVTSVTIAPPATQSAIPPVTTITPHIP
jgi:hypothetical protein